jgi:hypothetical protein
VLREVLIRGCVLYAVKRNNGAILRCEGTRSWKDELVDKRFRSINPEIRIRRIVENKNKDKLQKTGLYLSKCKEK